MSNKVKSGMMVGKLTVMELVRRHRTQTGQILNYWSCRCECGNSTEVTNRNLLSGHTLSCGCLKGKPIIHGFARKGRVHRFHMVWRNILARCQNPKNPSYRYYGGRGIFVCERWQKFENFRDDMFSGWQLGLTVERKDNNGPYSPTNCRWATKLEQSNNKTTSAFLEVDGLKLTYAQWQRETGVPQALIRQRHQELKWEPKECLSPINHHNKKPTPVKLRNGGTWSYPLSVGM